MRNFPGSVVGAAGLLIRRLPGKLHMYLHQKQYTSNYSVGGSNHDAIWQLRGVPRDWDTHFLGANNYCHFWTQSGKNHLQKYTGVIP